MRITHSLLASIALSAFTFAASAAENLAHNPAFTSHIDDIYHNPLSPAFGHSSGDVTIVEYYDYRCSYCKAMEEAVEKILAEDSGVIVIYKDFAKLGPLSQTAAQVTLASMRQGSDKYIRLHNLLMSKESNLQSEASLYEAAASAGLNVDQLKTDSADPALAKYIENTMATGRAIGVQMTPTFVINGYLFPGYADYDQLKKNIAYVRSIHARS